MSFYPEKNRRTVILSELLCVAREQMARGCTEQGRDDNEQNNNPCANEYNRYVWGTSNDGGRGFAYCASFCAFVIATAARRLGCTLAASFAEKGKFLAQVTNWDRWANANTARVSAPAPGLIYTRARVNLAANPRTVTRSKTTDAGHMGFIEQVRADGSIVTIDANAVDGPAPKPAVTRIEYSAADLARTDFEWVFIDPAAAIDAACNPTTNSTDCIPLYRTQSQDIPVDTNTTGRDDVNPSDSPSSDVGTVQRRRSRERPNTGTGTATGTSTDPAKSAASIISFNNCNSYRESLSAAVSAVASSGALHYQQLVDGNLQTRYRIVRDIIGFRGLAHAEGMSFLVNRDGSLTTPKKEVVRTVRKHASRREEITSPIEKVTPEAVVQAVVQAVGNSKPVTPGFMFLTDGVGNRYIIANEESENWAAFRNQIFPEGTKDSPERSMVRIEFYRSDNDSTPGERVRDILTNTTGNREPLAARMYRRQESGIVSMLRKAAQNPAFQGDKQKELNGLADYIANRPIVPPARYGGQMQSGIISQEVLRDGIYFFAAAYGATPEEKDEALLNLIERFCKEKNDGRPLSVPILIAFRKPNPPFDWGALFSKIFDIALAFVPVVGEGFARAATPLLTSGKSIAVAVARNGFDGVFNANFLASAYSFAAGFAPHLQLELESLPVFKNIQSVLASGEKTVASLFDGLKTTSQSVRDIINGFGTQFGSSISEIVNANSLVKNIIYGSQSLPQLSSALGIDLSVIGEYGKYLDQFGTSATQSFSKFASIAGAGTDKNVISSILGAVNISAATRAISGSLLGSHGNIASGILREVSERGGDWTQIPALRELLVPGSASASFAAIPQFEKILGPIAYRALMDVGNEKGTLPAIDSARAWVGSALGYKVAPDIFDQFSAVAVAKNIDSLATTSGEIVLPSSIPAHLRHDLAKELSKCFPGVRFWCGNGDCYSTNDTKPGTDTGNGGGRSIEFPNQGDTAQGSSVSPFTPTDTTGGKSLNPVDTNTGTGTGTNTTGNEKTSIDPKKSDITEYIDELFARRAAAFGPIIFNNSGCCECPHPTRTSPSGLCTRCGQNAAPTGRQTFLNSIDPIGCPPGSIRLPDGNCMNLISNGQGIGGPFCTDCEPEKQSHHHGAQPPVIVKVDSPAPAAPQPISIVVNVDNNSKEQTQPGTTTGPTPGGDRTRTETSSNGTNTPTNGDRNNANTVNNSTTTGATTVNAQGGQSQSSATGGSGGSANAVGGTSQASNANTVNVSLPEFPIQPPPLPPFPDPLLKPETIDRLVNTLIEQVNRSNTHPTDHHPIPNADTDPYGYSYPSLIPVNEMLPECPIPNPMDLIDVNFS